MARAGDRLKREFLELLEKDLEFRYAVAGFLGFSEILKRLEEHDKKFQEILAEIKALRENQDKLWEGQNKLWEEVRRLWEEVRALREDQKRLWESQNKLWEEVKALREDQGRLWEGQNKLWEEVRKLRESQDKLWEEVRKLWEEVRALREDQNKLWESTNKLWEEVRALREGQERLWGEVKALGEGQRRLESRVESLERRFSGLEKAVAMLARTVGVTLNDFVASFVEEMLRLSGVPEEKIKVSPSVRIVYGETVREVDIFNTDPLVVGQVTTYIPSVEEARRELGKLLEDVEFVEKITGRKVFMAILAVENAPEEVAALLESECEKHGVKFIPGRLIPRIPTY